MSVSLLMPPPPPNPCRDRHHGSVPPEQLRGACRCAFQPEYTQLESFAHNILTLLYILTHLRPSTSLLFPPPLPLVHTHTEPSFTETIGALENSKSAITISTSSRTYFWSVALTVGLTTCSFLEFTSQTLELATKQITASNRHLIKRYFKNDFLIYITSKTLLFHTIKNVPANNGSNYSLSISFWSLMLCCLSAVRCFAKGKC